MRFFLLCFFSFFCTCAFAQFPAMGGGKAPSIKGVIKGKVIDASTGEAVDYATIVLLNEMGTTQLNGALTEEGGKFKLADIVLGRYQVKISFQYYH